MADIDRERHVTVERDSSGVWAVVALIVVVLLVLLFLWPGWVYAPFASDTEGDTINIEQEQPDQDVDVEQPDQDVDIDVEEPDVDVEQPDSGTDETPEDDTTE
jgi:hypothetical protein